MMKICLMFQRGSYKTKQETYKHVSKQHFPIETFVQHPKNSHFIRVGHRESKRNEKHLQHFHENSCFFFRHSTQVRSVNREFSAVFYPIFRSEKKCKKTIFLYSSKIKKKKNYIAKKHFEQRKVLSRVALSFQSQQIFTFNFHKIFYLP